MKRHSENLGALFLSFISYSEGIIMFEAKDQINDETEETPAE